MKGKELHQDITQKAPLMSSANLGRLFEMMVDWWKGLRMADIAKKHGVSRQRVSKILASVSCTREWSRKARRDLPDSRRGERAEPAQEARQLLLHPFAWKLTSRQRGALAWRAQGLTLLSIAHRMACSTQAVFAGLWSGKEKLARLEYKHQQQIAVLEISPFDCSCLEDILAKPATKELQHASGGHGTDDQTPVLSGAVGLGEICDAIG